MDLQQAIRNRRTIHSFNDKPVSESIIQRALEAANFAPCHMHTFPWRFTSLKRDKRALLAKLGLQVKLDLHSLDQSGKERYLKKFLTPSHLLVASQVLNEEPKRKSEDYAACACAIQNLTLSLFGDGVGSKWSTGRITTHKNTYPIVDIDPELEKIIGFIWVGYGEKPPQIKRPLVSSISREF